MKIVKLGNLQFQQKSKIKAGEGKLSGLFKFFTSSSIQKKFIDQSIFEGPALIFGTGGSASVHFCDENFSTSTDCFILKSDNKDIELKYIYYHLSGNIDILEQGFKGAGLRHISKEYISNLEIPLPSIQTQKEIVNKLDKLSELISLRKESIKKQEDLTKSIFIEMFGDPMLNEKGFDKEKLGNISNVGSSTRVFTKDLKDSGIPFYRGSEVSALSYGKKIKSELFISEEHYNKILTRVKIPKMGDILLPSICPKGDIWEVDTEAPFYFKDGRVLWINLNNPNLNGTYLKFLLKEMFISNYSKISSGTTFSELKIFILKDLEIIFPPISLQNKFAIIVQKNEENIRKQKESLVKLEELYSGVMQGSFRF